jgi:hypothetical protein
MSSYSGPEIANDGLVFSYDISNNQKSWIGKPTVNYITNPTEEMPRGEFGQYRDLAPTFDTYGLVPYSLSMDMKVNKPGNVLVYMQNGSSTKYGFVGANVSATTEYQRFYFNNITPSISTPSDTAATLATYTEYGSGVTPTVKNIQLELGSFATPFVNGTRSNTQSVRDLTNINSITANSLTYASDGTFSFNGSNSITVPFNSSAFTFDNEQTIIIWMKNQSPSSARRNPYNQAYAGAGTITHENDTGFNYFYGTGGGDNEPYTALTTAFSVVVGETAMICFTRNTSTVSCYKNGVFSNSMSNPYGAVVTGTNNITIGSGYAGGFGGSLYAVQLYYRALSALEVQQNFNALRGRYGI